MDAVQSPSEHDAQGDTERIETAVDSGAGQDAGPVHLSSPCPAEGAIFCVDHDGVAAGHHVTDEDITDWFMANQVRAGITNDSTGGAIDIVTDPSEDPARGNVMRVFNSEGAKGFTDGLHPPSSGRWRSWAGKHDALYFAFDIYLEPDRLWSKVMKLPGLVAGDWAKLDGTLGFETRLMVVSSRAYPNKPDGALVEYAYYVDKRQAVRWANQGPAGQITIEPGRWYTIETYARVNTPGVSDGEMRMWVDGVQVLEVTNRKWRAVEGVVFDGLYFNFGYGGNTKSFAGPEDHNNYYDNWVLSTRPISH